MLSSLNAVIQTNENAEFDTGHVIYNPAYTYKFQLKTTLINSFIFKKKLTSFADVPLRKIETSSFFYK